MDVYWWKPYFRRGASDFGATAHPDAGDADHDSQDDDHRQRRVRGAGRRAAGVQGILIVGRGRSGNAGRTRGDTGRDAAATTATAGPSHRRPALRLRRCRDHRARPRRSRSCCPSGTGILRSSCPGPWSALRHGAPRGSSAQPPWSLVGAASWRRSTGISYWLACGVPGDGSAMPGRPPPREEAAGPRLLSRGPSGVGWWSQCASSS